MSGDLAHIFRQYDGDKENYYCIFCNLRGKRGQTVGIICPKRGGQGLMEFFETAYQCKVCDVVCEGFRECVNHFEKVHGDWRKFQPSQSK